VEGQSHKMRRGLQMALGGVAQGRIPWGGGGQSESTGIL